MAPALSIIVPTFRCADLLRRNLESLVPCAAALPGLEVLVQDGAGDRETAAAAREFAGRIPGLRVASEPDKNLYDAMNRAMDRATGEWLLFLGADDLVAHPAALPRILAAGAGADILQADLEVERPDGAPPTLFTRTITPERLFAGEGFGHQALIYRRSFVGDARYSLRYPVGADVEFNLRLIAGRRTRPRHVHEPLVRYGCHGLSSRTRDEVWRRERGRLLRGLYPARMFALKAAGVPVRECLRAARRPDLMLRFNDWLYGLARL